MSYFDDIVRAAALDLPWKKLSGFNILVTGATGLIGSCLVDVLMANPRRDYHIYAAGRNEERAKVRFKDYYSDAGFHFVNYDVLKPFEGETNFGFIIHAASNASPNFFATNPVEIIKSNILGLCNLMDYGLGHGLKRILYVSSGEVYGEGDGQVFEEDFSGYLNILSPRSCYPSSKRAAETLCVSYGIEYGVETVIARPCHTYGPCFTESDNRVYAQFIRSVRNGKDIVLKSSGNQFRSWCYVVDCVSALLYILLMGESGQAYNIADDSSNISIRELAEMIADMGGRKVIFQNPTEVEKANFNVVSKSVFSVEKLKRLGWRIDGGIYNKMKCSITPFWD